MNADKSKLVLRYAITLCVRRIKKQKKQQHREYCVSNLNVFHSKQIYPAFDFFCL